MNNDIKFLLWRGGVLSVASAVSFLASIVIRFL
jgi:hypothetical protein